MMSRTHFLSVAVAGALLATSCGGSSDSNPETNDTEPAATDAPEDEPDTTTAPTAPPADEQDEAPATEPDTTEAETTEAPAEAPDAREPGDGTSADQAAALAGAPIGWVHDDATWSFEMAGLLPVRARNVDNGECLVLFGTATAVNVGDRNWTSPTITPSIDLQVGDELISPNFGNTCDETATVDSDHADVANPKLISGASINFAYHYPLGESTLGDVDAVVWSGGDDLVPQYYLPTLIDAPPTAVVTAADYSGYASTPLAGASVEVETTSTFDLQFQGVAAAPTTSFAESYGPGECKVILGAATAVAAFRGYVTLLGTDVGLLTGGRLLANSQAECDVSEFEAAGYQPARHLSLTVGTSVDFYQAVFIPDELADAQQLVVTDAFFSNDPQFFEPTALDAIPAPLALADASIIPAASGPMNAETVSFQDDEDDPTFTIDLLGIHNAGPSDDGNDTCFYIFGTMTADQEVTNGADIGLITSGQYHDDTAFDCDDSAVEDAGWENVGQADFAAGDAVAFHELILVPNGDADGEQFVVIGNPSAADSSIVLGPMYLDAVPTP